MYIPKLRNPICVDRIANLSGKCKSLRMSVRFIKQNNWLRKANKTVTHNVSVIQRRIGYFKRYLDKKT
jgi:hypothetical protein